MAITAEDRANVAAWKNETGYQEDEGWFGQTQVNAYRPNQGNFYLGGDLNYAGARAAELSGEGTQQAGALRADGYNTGTRQRVQGRDQGNALTTQGIAGAVDADNRATGLSNQGQTGNALQQARALGFEGLSNQGLAAGNARAGAQTSGALQNQQAAQYDAQTYGDRSQNATLRPNVTTQGEQLNSDNRALETQGRAQQLQAAQALGYRASDGSGQQNTQSLRNFAAQTGQGPSAAEAQLRQGGDQSMSSALALARSGRGNNTGAMRQAMFQNAATQGQTNQQLATLRAQEHDQAQNRQLSALNSESQALQGYRGQDLQALQGAAGVLGQARGQDQSQQQLGIGQSQFDANLAMQNQAQRDAAALGWAGQQQTAAARGDQAFIQGQQLGNQSIGQAQQYGLGMQGLGQQASQAGQQFELGKDQLAGQAIGQGQQFQLGMANAGTQANLGLQALGNQYQLGSEGLANQYNLGMQGMANGVTASQLQANMAFEGLKSGNLMNSQISNAGNDQARDAANIGMVGGVIGGVAGGMMASDERSKKQISSLKGQLAEAYSALGGPPQEGAYDRNALDEAYRRQGGEPNRTDEAESRYGLSHSKRRGDDDPYDLWASDRAGDPYDLWASKGAAPRVDLRKAQGYSYKYKNPDMSGASSGMHVGPMAQDLERSPATAGTVVTGPDGVKRVDAPRLTMVNTAALSDQQREIQEIKQLLETNDPGFDRDALDEAHKRQAAGWR